MKTALEIEIDVRELISVPELLTQIDGQVYPFIRPVNSDKKDITVSILSVNNEQMQEATVNIRIHSPNPSFEIPDKQMVDRTRPDLVTFNRLAKIICELTDSQYRETFHTAVTEPGRIYRQEDGSHTCLVQLDYYSIQNNFKNI